MERKMIPKTELKYSWMYNSLFNPKFDEGKIKKLKSKCKKFEHLYKKNINFILKIIQENLLNWKEEYIPIFIIEKGSVFFEPLTIRYEENSKIMLIRLFHELIHINIKEKKFKNHYLLHKYMDKKMIPLLSKIPTNLTNEVYILKNMTEKFKNKK